ncbi:hypothetical protein BV898_01183 [Hypsibius exemplaris]|uniref:Uncharacterized protein n=1 Tax=Hypsibius exemplaris TaxID=2072580 RepID=A0A1W0XBY9_HYPEX|nr:hypothetical protein BV898_01183 [Hypsibius exemplaris]
MHFPSSLNLVRTLFFGLLIVLVYCEIFFYSFQFGIGALRLNQLNMGNTVKPKSQVPSVRLLGTSILFLSVRSLPGICEHNFRGHRNLFFFLALLNNFLTVFVMAAPLIFPYPGFSQLRYIVLEGFSDGDVFAHVILFVREMVASVAFTVPS